MLYFGSWPLYDGSMTKDNDNPILDIFRREILQDFGTR